MRVLRSFLVLSLILATSALAVPPGGFIVDRAIRLKAEVDKANQDDLETLWKDVQKVLPDLDEAKLKARLMADKEAFRKIRAALPKEGVSYEFRFALPKLIGIEDATTGMVLYSGILDDAAKLLAEGALHKSLDDINPKLNTVTVLKTLLLYAKAEGEDQANLTQFIEVENLEANVKMLYGTPVPGGLDPKLIDGLTLTCATPKSKRFYIPNAGYVYGGNFVDGTECRGIDCSSFVSHCAQSRIRMWTRYQDFLWREIRGGESAFAEDEKADRKNMIEKSQLIESTRDFEAIDNDMANLKPGDLVTWIKGKGGHTVIFLAPKTDKIFVAVEANRADDKTKEGIEINDFELVQEGKRTTVLRRK